MSEALINNLDERQLNALKAILSLINEPEKVEIMTLKVFAEEYSKLIKQNQSNAYYLSVVYSLKHLTNYFEEQKSIQSIGLKDVENFVTHLQMKIKKGYRVYYRTLKAAFNKAIDWGYVRENYFLKVKLPKKQQVNPAFINSEQLSIISEQLKNEVVRDVVVFAFYTGMRLNEIVNLTWKNVDITTRLITVGDENFTTKGRNTRKIPICDELFEILLGNQKSKTEEGYVFCKSNGKQFSGDYLSRRFKRACKVAGMDNTIHFHSLRHSFASNLVQQDVSLYTIKELLGHSSISTTEIYSHLNMDTLKEAIKKFDRSKNYD